MPTDALAQEKLDQAVGVLGEQDVDLWLTFVRETSLTRDPCLDLLGGDVLRVAGRVPRLAHRRADRDRRPLRRAARSRRSTRTTPSIGYDESIRPDLRAAIERLDPRSIALNYSESDPAADGLTHGLWLTLRDTLEGTPYADRLTSSERVVNALRGRKSAVEVERVRAAVAETEEIFDAVTAALAPGLSEIEIAELMHAEVARRGLGYAWERDHCPAVNAGPEKEVGHAGPSELRTKRGELVHIDFGVSKDEYCSDLQRVWYLLDEGETEAPPEVRARGTRCGPRWTQARRRSGRARSAGRSTRPRAARSRTRATRSRCTRSATSSAARRTTAARCSRRAGTATATRRSALVEAGNVFTLEYGTRGAGARLRRARGGRARDGRRRRVALDAAARALARLVAA